MVLAGIVLRLGTSGWGETFPNLGTVALPCVTKEYVPQVAKCQSKEWKEGKRGGRSSPALGLAELFEHQ